MTLAHFAGFTDGLVTTAGAVYVEWALPHEGVSHVWRVSRYDVATHRVTAVSRSIRGAGAMAVADGALWIAAGPGDDAAGGSLVKLDLSTLGLDARFETSTPVQAMVATPHGLWYSQTALLSLLDPHFGRVIAGIPITGVAGSLAYDASADLLYDATQRRSERTAIALEERDATTGNLVARSTAIKSSTAINSLAVVPSGVWVAIVGGMTATAERFSRESLVRHRPPEGELVGTNGMAVYSTPSLLWADNPGGDLACVDPLNGIRRDDLVGPRFKGSIAGLDGHPYRVIGQQLQRVEPGRACAG